MIQQNKVVGDQPKRMLRNYDFPMDDAYATGNTNAIYEMKYINNTHE